MRFWVGVIALSLTPPVLSDSLTRNQSDALVDGVKKTTRTLLKACAISDNIVQCAEASGIHCENAVEKADRDYRCVTRATTEFTVDETVPPAISAIWEVTFRVFYSGERWNVGPETIGRVAN